MLVSGEEAQVAWGCACRGHPSEEVCGDVHLVTAVPGGLLLAVADGLGHGPEAREAALLATASIALDPDKPLHHLFARCHQALRKTRGAALSVAVVRPGTVTWLGVGNVEGVITHAQPGAGRTHLLCQAGVMGLASLPRLREATVVLAANGLVVLATDGIHGSFTEHLLLQAPPAEVAMQTLGRFALARDDALVLAARPAPMASAASGAP